MTGCPCAEARKKIRDAVRARTISDRLLITTARRLAAQPCPHLDREIQLRYGKETTR